MQEYSILFRTPVSFSNLVWHGRRHLLVRNVSRIEYFRNIPCIFFHTFAATRTPRFIAELDLSPSTLRKWENMDHRVRIEGRCLRGRIRRNFRIYPYKTSFVTFDIFNRLFPFIFYLLYKYPSWNILRFSLRILNTNKKALTYQINKEIWRTFFLIFKLLSMYLRVKFDFWNEPE